MSITRMLAIAALAVATAGPARADKPADAFRERLALAQGDLAVNLVQQLVIAKKPMVVVSPASVAGAASTLNLGASHPLRSALHGVLGFRKGADVAADFASLQNSLKQLTAGNEVAGGKPEKAETAPLRFANAIVFDDGVELYPGAKLALADAGVSHSVLDLQAPESAKAINETIKKATGGLIPEMLEGPQKGATLLVLNALHFKDRWKTPFNRADTRPASFKRVAAAPLTVSTMHLPQGRYRFRQDARFVGIELPYARDRFSMVIVTTRGEKAAPARHFRAVGEWLSGKGFAPAAGELALPHFDVSNGEDITRALDVLGLRAARLSPGALAGFTPDRARITRVMQRIELRLNEEGTQAAAATAVTAERGVDKNYIRMVVDKPFMFALRDSVTGLILVAGYVGEPTGLATAAR